MIKHCLLTLMCRDNTFLYNAIVYILCHHSKESIMLYIISTHGIYTWTTVDFILTAHHETNGAQTSYNNASTLSSLYFPCDVLALSSAIVYLAIAVV